MKVLQRLASVCATVAIVAVAIVAGRVLWVHYMDEPWTRDGRIRVDVIDIAPDVSGEVVELPVKDNQFVRKGDLLMQVDPSHYAIAVEQAEANVAAKKADLELRRDNARRRADLDSEVVSAESSDDANHSASAAEAAYQQALAELDAAKLNLSRTRVVAPVDGYVTNLNYFKGDYAVIGVSKLAMVDSNSFWVYGYFEETKLPKVKVGEQAQIRLMSGAVLQGHVDSISRGIYDSDNPESHDLLSDVNPVFNWVRLAQRVPVRIHIDKVPQGVVLSAGTTCTVVVDPA